MKFLIILTLCVIFNKNQQSMAQNITCSYKNEDVHYTCNLNTQNWKYNRVPTRIVGQHLGGKKNSDVKNLFIVGENLLRIFSSIFCQKFPNLVKIHIENAQIELIEGSALAQCQNLEMLTMTGNKFSEIPEYLLVINSKIHYFKVTDSQLKYLPENLFREQLELKGVELNNNQLDFLPSKIFHSVVKLKGLNLENNKLQSLDPKWFSQLQDLSFLSLAGNQITEIPPKIFEPLKSLHSFFFDNNRIKFLYPESFAGLKNVYILSMKNNIISELPKNVFVPLKKMRQLWMEKNMIKTIHSDSFDLNNIPQRINFEQNNISSIDPKFIDDIDWISIGHLELGGNICTGINTLIYPIKRKLSIPECTKDYQPRSQVIEQQSSLQTNSCGKPVAALGILFGGTKIAQGSAPWIAALVHSDSGQYFCGGTLISSRKVLTGAHCIWEKTRNNPKLPKDFFVTLGMHDLNKFFEVGRTTKAVQQINIHQDWNPYTTAYDADIAVIILDHPVIFDSYIQPVCLIPPSSTLINLKKAFVIGYGLNENKIHEKIPKFVESPIRDHLECFIKNDAHQSILSGRALCSGYGHGKGVCIGDSGGGLYVNQSGVYYQRGIVSSAINGGPFDCYVDDYAVFTDTTKFYDWIQEIPEDS